uniref:FCH and mu domain containing endocytic adaptor 2 n=1 Tax=Astyanax mexicanus TaxID=7994 RepID=A0A8B9RGK0_ASTMX
MSFFNGEKNNGFDVLYHNMKHGQISSKELSDFIRERVTIEETYSRSMSKLAKSASNFSQLGTFAPIWDVFKVSTEKLASCHMELVRKLQELIKEVQKYVDEQAKAHKKTKEEVASTLEAVQNIQSVSQALQKSKENYNSKTLEQERMRKEGATQRDLDKTGVKVKKATEVYKSFVEKYATTKTEFEQKMAETAQKFQDIEESHILHMKEIIQSYSCSVEDTHKQIEELHQEFVNNMENTSVESLIQKLAESKGTGKERPGKRKHNNSLLIHLNFPVTLASQDALPIAVAFTESVNAYFKGADPSKCIVKITGDMTLSFPSGIIKIFTSSPSPAVLSFKLKNTSKLEQILPNQHLLHSDSSQSDTNTRDFWLNMPALTAYLRKNSEQNPTSSYYNVDVLKYQVCSNGIQSTPLNLAVYWKCGPTTTDLRVDYRYNPEAMQPHGPLSSVQVLVPVNGGVTNMQSIPNNKSLWKLNDISEKSENEGSGSLRAKFELSDGPSIPATLAVQFFNEGSTLSGVDMELVGSGYRLSLNKKRFASGKTFHLSFYRPNSA